MQVNGVPLVQLPEKRVHVIKVDMTRAQRTKYNAWMGAGRTVVRNFIAADTLMQNWAHVLQILTRCTALYTREKSSPRPEEPSSCSSNASRQFVELFLSLIHI